MKRPARILISAGAGLALLTGGTAAGAAIAKGPVDSSGVIHGCWTNAAINGSHVFVMQDAGTNCPKGTTAISWNQQGATGPAGPAGATGPAGAKGDTGAPGPAGPQGPQGPAGANGNTLLNGTVAPDNSVGNLGDFYLDVATDMLFGPKTAGGWPATGISLVGPTGPQGDTGPAGTQGPAGPSGLTGPQGPAGANGNAVLNGTGKPGDALGNDGDFYLDTATDTLYGPKAGGAWPTPGTSLVGPAGPAGPTGPAGLSTAGPGGLDITRVAQTDPNAEPGVLVWAVCTRDHPYLVSGGASLPGTGGVGLVESAPINAVLSTDAAAGDQIINISGDARAFAEGMPVSIDSGTSEETGVVALGLGSPNSTGGQGSPTGSGVELFSALSNAHSAGAVITGQGWQAQMFGNGPLTVWALCAK